MMHEHVFVVKCIGWETERDVAKHRGMKWLRTALGVVGLTALLLSSGRATRSPEAVVALIAGLAMSVAVFFELRAARRAKAAG